MTKSPNSTSSTADLTPDPASLDTSTQSFAAETNVQSEPSSVTQDNSNLESHHSASSSDSINSAAATTAVNSSPTSNSSAASSEALTTNASTTVDDSNTSDNASEISTTTTRKRSKSAKANPKSDSAEKKIAKKSAKSITNSTDTNPNSDNSTAKASETATVSANTVSKKSAKTSGRITPSFRVIVISLLCVSLLTSAASLAYVIWDFLRGDTPITFNYAGDGNSANFTEGSIAEVASKVTPGVVSIVTEVRTTSFFGQSSTSTAAGTGMIVTKDGYVLTNKHVIDGANKIQVVLDDGTTYSDVEVVTTDPLNDVAFLKIKNVSDLPTVKLGDSKTITAGQQVIAIGNALGQFQNTITSGIISGTGRSITASSNDTSSSESLTDMIQTDAAINSGNSGGPLVNAAGEVIGINTATSANADGIGFAIPISSVKGMLKNLVDNNAGDRSYIGVYYVNITPDVAKAYDLPVSSGAYVYSQSQYSAVVKDGPAAKAGLKEKDIITKINGVKVGSAGSVSSLIGEYAPGDTIQLTVLRDGKERSLNVTLGKCPTEN